MNVFVKWKNNRLHREHLREQVLAQEISTSLLIVKREEEEMTSKPCAHRDMKNCSSQCVHFCVGEVLKTKIYKSHDYFVYHNSPKCKLWAN